ncbi:hypothetical protein [Ferrovum myxofaciens]|uniref:hypothetical protein n=1 Tax=Ferrovum myxofaciens TaxID=416213 RepID=UPI0012370A9A|nr:hypothetical protein [Ferrovum myxofaciens]
MPFAIPQTATASLLTDEQSWVQRQVSELSGRLARQPTDWRSAIPVFGPEPNERQRSDSQQTVVPPSR